MKITAIASAVAAALLATSAAHAENEFTFIPSIAYQNKHLEFDQEYTAGVLENRKAEFSVDIPTVSLTATGVYGKFYASLKYETELSEASTAVDEDPHSSDPILGQRYLLNTPEGDETLVGRDDQSLTIGMNVIDNLNIFLGYMEGTTTLTPDAMCANICTQPWNIAYDHQVAGIREYQQEYNEEGPFIGASYGYRIADIGTLSGSIAYAKMDGSYKDNYAAVADENFKYAGDSTGFSLGITWSAPLTERVGYFLDLRRQSYSMDGKDKTGNAGLSDSEVTTDETMINLTAGIQMYF